MVYDSHKNFGFTVVGVAPATPTGGTTFSVLNANAANLPDPASVGAYNLTVAAANQQPLSSNSEIIRVTAKGAADSGGAGFTQFTISRLAENNAGGSMTARSIQVGDWISHSITAKTLTDVETNKLDRDGSQAMTGTLTFASLTTTQQNALTPVNGMTHYNSTKALFQKYENSQWVDISKSPATKVVAPSGSGYAADYYFSGTNDDVTMQAGLDALNTLGGGTLLVKGIGGLINIHALMTLYPNIHIKGEGIGKTIFKLMSTYTGGDMFIIGGNGGTSSGTADPAGTYANISMSDFEVDLNGKSASIALYAPANFRAERIYLHNGANYGFYIANGNDVWIQDCILKSFTGSGTQALIQFKGVVNGWVINNHGYDNHGAAGTQGTDSHATDGVNGRTGSNNHFINNYIELCGQGMNCEDNNSEMLGNTIINTVGEFAMGLHNNPVNLTIANNIIDGQSGTGSVIGISTFNATSGCSNIKIHGNTIRNINGSVTSDGMFIGTNTGICSVENNTITGSGRYAIYNRTPNLLLGINHMTGNTSGDVFNDTNASVLGYIINQYVSPTGQKIVVKAGDADVGVTNANGGELSLQSGIGTGNSGGSFISFYTAGSGSSGTTAETLTERMRLAGSTNGRLWIGVNPFETGSGDGLTLGGRVARQVAIARNAASNTAGQNLTVQSGGATLGATDKAAGNLILTTGIPTGTGSASILFQTPTPQGSTNTTDNSPVTRMTISSTGIDVSSLKITSLLDPTGAQDAATKNYVDTVAQGLSPKPSAVVATIAGLPTYTYNNGSSGVGATITGLVTGVLTIDGYTVALNDYILVKDETSTNAPNNGLYKCTIAGAVGVAFVLTRAVEMNQPTEFDGGFIFIEQGTVNTSSGWVCTTTGTVTIGTTNIGFTQFSGAGEIIAGNGLSKSANTLSINTSITVDKTTAQTLTNKTLTSPVITTPTGIVKGDIGLGNVENIALSTWAGSANITTLGTIISGIWTGTTIAVANGGTGQTSYTNGQLLIGNTTGNTLTKTTLTAGNSITITNGTGSITIDTIQDIRTTANVTFGSVTTAGVVSSDQIIISATAGASLAVGRNGTTNSTFQVDSSIASAVTGILIKGNIATSGVALSVQSSGTDENLTIDAKGAGTITLGGTSTGNIVMSRTLNLGTNNINTVGNVEIDGSTARDITVGTNTDGNNGVVLVIASGSVLSGGTSTDKSGGELRLKANAGTGNNGNSLITFYTSTAGSTGTTAQTVSEKMRLLSSSNGRLLLGTGGSSNGSADGFMMGGTVVRSVGVVRHPTVNNAGVSLTINAGGASSIATTTDKAGGNLLLQPGISTGTGRQYVSIQGYNVALSTGSTDNTLLDRIIIGAFKALTNNSAINLINCTLASNTLCGGIIKYTIEVFDSTNLQMEVGEIMFACVNKGGVFSLNTMTQIGSAKQTLGSGTLTVTWAISAANPAVISLNANSSLTPATGYPRVTYSIENYTQQAIAIQ